MFSANENVQLRQAKKRVVAWIEELIPEDTLDLGVNVMVMQVSCKSPGCVPVETFVIIVFPKSETELLPGLPESRGGSYKTKVLKPLSQVTKEDVLDVLPPAFPGGQRSMEKLCLQARDLMLVQITQLFGEESDTVDSRRLMAEYLQQSLQEYIQHGCIPPEWGQPFSAEGDNNRDENGTESTAAGAATASSSPSGKGNIVIQRPVDDEEEQVPQQNVPSASFAPSPAPSEASVNSMTLRRQQQAAEQRIVSSGNSSSSSSMILTQLSQREHAPGVRRAGCPCCDPDNPSNVVDRMMML
jgi:hypothetical protein